MPIEYASKVISLTYNNRKQNVHLITLQNNYIQKYLVSRLITWGTVSNTAGEGSQMVSLVKPEVITKCFFHAQLTLALNLSWSFFF